MKTTASKDMPLPYLVAINLTKRCNLNCAHCYLDASQRALAEDGELTHRELAPVFADIARHAPGTIIVLSGGEPLLHPELEPLVASGVAAGLRMVIGTNGVLLAEARIKRFKELGVAGVAVSLDSVCADQHDAFRGVVGSFEKSCRAIRACAGHGLHAQVNFTVTRANLGQLASAVDLARELGAMIISFFFLVCVGRGKHAMDLPAALYERALAEIAGLQQRRRGIMLQARCAPYFKRVLYHQNPASPYTRATGYDGGGCLAGTHYCRIAPQGEVTPCPYLELSAGNICQRSFWEIWQQAPLFQSLREPALTGRCGRCEYRLLCGGCRARSLAQTGDLMGEDPSCEYEPPGNDVVSVQSAASPETPRIIWTEEATERLERIPLFVRHLVKQRLEERAAAQGVPITVELMQQYRQEREQAMGIKFH